MAADGDVFHRRQVTATYAYRPHLWHGPIPRFAGRALSKTFDRLTGSKRLTMCLMGDSISEGYNASGFIGVAPLQPPFGRLVADGIERAHGASVSFHNFGVAGSTADNGVWETAPVSKVQPDLVLIAYGMNDAGYASAADFTGRIQKIMSQIRGGAPAAEFVLVAPMLPHPEWDYVIEGRILEYRDGLARLCGDGVVIADVTSLWSALLARKSQYRPVRQRHQPPERLRSSLYDRRSWACWSKHSVTSRTCQVWKVMAFLIRRIAWTERVAHVCRALAGASSLILAISSGTAAQTVERAAEGPTLTEGPTVDREGNLYFTELRFRRIFKVDTKGELTVFRENSHSANGLVIDLENRLIACEGAADGQPPRITRTDLRTGALEVLVDSYQGMPLKGTNDVTIDNKGRVGLH